MLIRFCAARDYLSNLHISPLAHCLLIFCLKDISTLHSSQGSLCVNANRNTASFIASRVCTRCMPMPGLYMCELERFHIRMEFARCRWGVARLWFSSCCLVGGQMPTRPSTHNAANRNRSDASCIKLVPAGRVPPLRSHALLWRTALTGETLCEHRSAG